MHRQLENLRWWRIGAGLIILVLLSAVFDLAPLRALAAPGLLAGLTLRGDSALLEKNAHARPQQHWD